MPQNLKSAAVGLAFVFLAIAGYQIIYKEGIWRPNQSTHDAIGDAIARADRVTASQARADLDALLSRAEKGERLDRAELERLIKAAATDAGNLDALWKEAETKSKGQIIAPPPQPSPQVQSTPAAEEAVVPRRDPAEVARLKFFDSTVKLPIFASYGEPTWTQVKLPPGLLQVETIVEEQIALNHETYDQRAFTGPKGLPVHAIPHFQGPHDPPNTPSAHSEGLRRELVSPNHPWLAALIRVCDVDMCSQPRAYTGYAFVSCLKPGQWIEFRVNVLDGMYSQRNPSGHGYNLTFRPLTGGCQ